MKIKKISIYSIRGGIFHNKKREHVSLISFVGSTVLISIILSFIIYNSLTLNTLTGINEITEFMYKQVFANKILVEPKESDVNSDHMLVSSVGLFPLHVYAHDMSCKDISFTISVWRNNDIINSTKLECFYDIQWKDIHNKVPEDFKKVVYDLMRSDVNYECSITMDYEISQEMKQNDHSFEVGIGWANRIVSSNVGRLVMGVTLLSNRLNLNTQTSFGWKAYI